MGVLAIFMLFISARAGLASETGDIPFIHIDNYTGLGVDSGGLYSITKDSNFMYTGMISSPAADYIFTYSVDSDGILTRLANYSMGGYRIVTGLHSTEDYLLAITRINGIYSLYINQTDGTLSTVGIYSDSNHDGGSIIGDSNYVYTGDRSPGGVNSYSLNSSGHLTYISNANRGLSYPDDFSCGIWVDGDFIYSNEGALVTYEVNSSGHLAYINASNTLGDCSEGGGVWGDGNYLYLGTASGIYSFSVDGSGIVTPIDSHFPLEGFDSRAVYGDDNFIYLGGENKGVHAYSVGGNGFLTHLGMHNDSGLVHAVYADEDFVYTGRRVVSEDATPLHVLNFTGTSEEANVSDVTFEEVFLDTFSYDDELNFGYLYESYTEDETWDSTTFNWVNSTANTSHFICNHSAGLTPTQTRNKGWENETYGSEVIRFNFTLSHDNFSTLLISAYDSDADTIGFLSFDGETGIIYSNGGLNISTFTPFIYSTYVIDFDYRTDKMRVEKDGVELTNSLTFTDGDKINSFYIWGDTLNNVCDWSIDYFSMSFGNSEDLEVSGLTISNITETNAIANWVNPTDIDFSQNKFWYFPQYLIGSENYGFSPYESFQMSALYDDVLYNFTIAPIDSFGNYGENVSVLFTTNTDIITNLNFESATDDSIKINWDNPTSGNFSYVKLYVEDLFGTFIDNTTNTTYNITTLSSGTSYNFTIYPVNTEGILGWGTSIIASTLGDTTSTSQITNLFLFSKTDTSAIVHWDNPVELDFNYSRIWLFFPPSPDFGYNTFVTNNDSFNVGGLSPSTSYNFTIMPFDLNGNGANNISIIFETSETPVQYSNFTHNKIWDDTFSYTDSICEGYTYESYEEPNIWDSGNCSGALANGSHFICNNQLPTWAVVEQFILPNETGQIVRFNFSFNPDDFSDMEIGWYDAIGSLIGKMTWISSSLTLYANGDTINLGLYDSYAPYEYIVDFDYAEESYSISRDGFELHGTIPFYLSDNQIYGYEIIGEEAQADCNWSFDYWQVWGETDEFTEPEYEPEFNSSHEIAEGILDLEFGSSGFNEDTAVALGICEATDGISQCFFKSLFSSFSGWVINFVFSNIIFLLALIIMLMIIFWVIGG